MCREGEMENMRSCHIAGSGLLTILKTEHTQTDTTFDICGKSEVTILINASIAQRIVIYNVSVWSVKLKSFRSSTSSDRDQRRHTCDDLHFSILTWDGNTDIFRFQINPTFVIFTVEVKSFSPPTIALPFSFFLPLSLPFMLPLFFPLHFPLSLLFLFSFTLLSSFHSHSFLFLNNCFLSKKKVESNWDVQLCNRLRPL